MRNQYRKPSEKFYSERLGQPIKQRYLSPKAWETEKRERLAEEKKFRRWAIHRGIWPSQPRSRP